MAKETAKKAAPKAAKKETETKTSGTDALEALGLAIEEARKAGIVVKAIATCNTDEKGTTVRY